ncbi:hypothetical protein GVAV_002518 [Gurleya vavrai]
MFLLLKLFCLWYIGFVTAEILDFVVPFDIIFENDTLSLKYSKDEFSKTIIENNGETLCVYYDLLLFYNYNLLLNDILSDYDKKNFLHIKKLNCFFIKLESIHSAFNSFARLNFLQITKKYEAYNYDFLLELLKTKCVDDLKTYINDKILLTDRIYKNSEAYDFIVERIKIIKTTVLAEFKVFIDSSINVFLKDDFLGNSSTLYSQTQFNEENQIFVPFKTDDKEIRTICSIDTIQKKFMREISILCESSCNCKNLLLSQYLLQQSNWSLSSDVEEKNKLLRFKKNKSKSRSNVNNSDTIAVHLRTLILCLNEIELQIREIEKISLMIFDKKFLNIKIRLKKVKNEILYVINSLYLSEGYIEYAYHLYFKNSKRITPFKTIIKRKQECLEEAKSKCLFNYEVVLRSIKIYVKKISDELPDYIATIQSENHCNNLNLKINEKFFFFYILTKFLDNFEKDLNQTIFLCDYYNFILNKIEKKDKDRYIKQIKIFYKFEKLKNLKKIKESRNALLKFIGNLHKMFSTFKIEEEKYRDLYQNQFAIYLMPKPQELSKKRHLTI